jgi:hypothetical protein
MRPSQTFAVLFAVAFLSWPTRSLAIYEARARYELHAAAIAADLPANKFQQFNGQHTTASTTYEPLAGASDGTKHVFLAADSGVYGGSARIVNGEVMAEANAGILKVRVDFELYAENRIALGFIKSDVALAIVDLARATATWRDTSTEFDPSLPFGAPIFDKAKIKVTGMLSPIAGDFCCTEVAVGITIRDATGVEIAAADAWKHFPADPSDHKGAITSEEIEVIRFSLNGLPHDFGYTLDLAGRGTADRSFPAWTSIGHSDAEILADYSKTLTWGGITGVFNAETGEPLTNWTITSESGFDYSKPYVPEPTSIVLLSSAFCTWLGCARPRRRRL